MVFKRTPAMAFSRVGAWMPAGKTSALKTGRGKRCAWDLGGSEDSSGESKDREAAFKSADAELDLIVWPPRQTVCLRRVGVFGFGRQPP